MPHLVFPKLLTYTSIGIPILLFLSTISSDTGPNYIFTSIGIILGILLYGYKRKIFSKKISELEIQISEVKKRFMKETKIPGEHANPYKLSKFIEYIDAELADTLKECANLYFQEENAQAIIDSNEQVAAELAASSSRLSKDMKEVSKSVDHVRDKF